MNIFISHSKKYDYINKIYNPIKNSNLVKSNNFFFHMIIIKPLIQKKLFQILI